MAAKRRAVRAQPAPLGERGQGASGRTSSARRASGPGSRPPITTSYPEGFLSEALVAVLEREILRLKRDFASEGVLRPRARPLRPRPARRPEALLRTAGPLGPR